MENKEKVIDLGKEEHRRKWESRKRNALLWWEENKQVCLVVVPIAGTILGKAIGMAKKGMNQHHELKVKDLRCYDTSLGHYWELRRKLDNRDWTEINRRRDNGESLGRILEDMNVLR